MHFSHTIRPKADDRLSLSFASFIFWTISAPKLLDN